MTPKDWNEMKKLLADVAKGNDVQEILGKVANGVKVEFRSPVSAQAWRSTSAAAVTGTGKGLLYLALHNNNQYTLIVDGVTLFNKMQPQQTGYVSLEFSSSFSIKGLENYSNGGIAFFY